MLDSIRVKQSEYQATLGLTNLTAAAFDNCELKLNTTQPTDLCSDTFESITTALFYQLEHGVKPEHLKYAKYIWECHPFNEK